MTNVPLDPNVTPQARFVNVARPASTLTDEVQVRRHDMRRIWMQVYRMGNPVESASAWSYTWFGVAVAAGLSLAALSGKHDQISRWVLDAHWCALIIGAFLSVFCWWIDHQNRRNQTTQKDMILRELEAMEPSCADQRPSAADGNLKRLGAWARTKFG